MRTAALPQQLPTWPSFIPRTLAGPSPRVCVCLAGWRLGIQRAANPSPPPSPASEPGVGHPKALSFLGPLPPHGNRTKRTERRGFGRVKALDLISAPRWPLLGPAGPLFPYISALLPPKAGVAPWAQQRARQALSASFGPSILHWGNSCDHPLTGKKMKAQRN